jgi:hypothetical protein
MGVGGWGLGVEASMVLEASKALIAIALLETVLAIGYL